MESKQDINDFEQALRTDLHQYLLSLDKVDGRLPEAPDIEELWPKIGESYLPDGMREFADYPTVSLGWMMFLGMAIAKYWDTDWELYSKVADLYHYLRDQRDYGTIYAVLYDNHNAKGEAICLYGDNVQTSDRVVALARLDNIDDTPEWTPFTLNFIYRKAVDAQKLRTGGYSLAIVCSSSTSGAEFMGAVGSTLWVDQFRVVCE